MHPEAAIQVLNCLHVATFAIFYYDYLLTFPAEVEVIWKRFRASGSWWYLVNRYLAFFGTAVITVFNFIGSYMTPKKYETYLLFRQGLLVLSIVVVAAILIIRTYALYNRDKRILALLLTVSGSLLAVSCWSLTRQHGTAFYESVSGGCHVQTSDSEARLIVVAWLSLFAFDTLLFILTASRAMHLSSSSSRRPSGRSTWKRFVREAGGLDIVDIVWRDGALYFAIMALVNLANVFTFYYAEPLLKGVLSTPSSGIASVLCARLMLNLHESSRASSAQRLPSRSTGVGLGDSQTEAGAAFTSQFEIGMDIQVDEHRASLSHMPAAQIADQWRPSEHTVRSNGASDLHTYSQKSLKASSSATGHGSGRQQNAEDRDGWEMDLLTNKDEHIVRT